MKNRPLNPSTITYNQLLEILRRQKQEEPRPGASNPVPARAGKPPQKSHLRPFRVIVDDGRADFLIEAKTISSAYSKSVKRLGLGHTITVDGGNQTLIGREELE